MLYESQRNGKPFFVRRKGGEVAYKVGDYVNYRKSGICIVDAIKRMDIGQGRKEYFILRSVYDEQTVIKLPVDSPAVSLNMRRVLTKGEIDDIISRQGSNNHQWIDDYKKRATAFMEILDGEDRGDILWMIKALSLYKINSLDTNRKFGVTDDRILSRAAKMIEQEFSFILGIPEEEVMPYIIERSKQAA